MNIDPNVRNLQGQGLPAIEKETEKTPTIEERTKRQVGKVGMTSVSDSPTLEGREVGVRGKNFSAAQEVFGHGGKEAVNEQDKTLLQNANLRLKRPEQPNNEVLKILKHENIGLRYRKNGKLVITLEGENANPDKVVADFERSISQLPLAKREDIRTELFSFLSSKSTDELLQDAIYDSNALVPKYRDAAIERKAIKAINESGGRVMLVQTNDPEEQQSELHFELCDVNDQSRMTSIQTLLDICRESYVAHGYKRDWFESWGLLNDIRISLQSLRSILDSPVLNPVFKNREFWDSPVGKDFMNTLKETVRIEYSSVSDVFKVLDRCGDNLKLTTDTDTTLGGFAYWIEPKKEGEDPLELRAVLHLLIDADRANITSRAHNVEESIEDFMMLMRGSNYVKTACEKAGVGSFDQLNQSIEKTLAGLKTATLERRNEKVEQFKNYLKTDKGKTWGNLTADKTGSELFLVPELRFLTFEKKRDAEKVFTVTAEMTPQWCYWGGEGIKTHAFREDQRKNEISLEPATLQFEVPDLGVTPEEATNLVIFAFGKIPSEKVVISEERKIYEDNLRNYEDNVLNQFRSMLKDMSDVLGPEASVKCEIRISKKSKNEDGSENVTFKMTPYWVNQVDPENKRRDDPVRFKPLEISIDLKEMTYSQWRLLEVNLIEDESVI